MFTGPVPPVVSFSLGSLGFMTPFGILHICLSHPIPVKMIPILKVTLVNVDSLIKYAVSLFMLLVNI